jgi:hypothetical protein
MALRLLWAGLLRSPEQCTGAGSLVHSAWTSHRLAKSENVRALMLCPGMMSVPVSCTSRGWELGSC